MAKRLNKIKKIVLKVNALCPKKKKKNKNHNQMFQLSKKKKDFKNLTKLNKKKSIDK